MDYDKKINGVIYDGTKVVGCDKNIKYVKIRPGTQIIGENAFEDCIEMESIDIPNSVESIEACAFLNCNSLQEIFIPASVKKIENDVFVLTCNLKKINVDSRNTVFDVEDGILYEGNALKCCPECEDPIVVRDGTIQICSGAFDSHQYSSVYLPDSIERIGDWAFRKCSLYSINIPVNVSDIGEEPFYECEITEIKLYASDYYAYENMLEEAFVNRIIIGRDVKDIHKGFLCTCVDGYPKLIVEKGNPYFLQENGAIFIADRFGKFLLRCSRSTKGRYEVPEGTYGIHANAFSGCTKITSLSIPKSVKIIKDTSFGDLTGLIGIDVDPHNTIFSSMNGMLFEGNTLLACPSRRKGIVDIPIGTNVINLNAFCCCSYITTIRIPKTLISISIENDYYSWMMPRLERLERIEVDAYNQKYMDVDGVLYDKQNKVLLRCPRQKKE